MIKTIVQKHYFRAPKLVLTFFASLPSVSLSSAAAVTFLPFFDCPARPPPPPPVLLGVGAPDVPSLLFPPKVLDMGVGAGVEPGVCESWVLVIHSSVSGATQQRTKKGIGVWETERVGRRTAALGLYDTELREKTRFWSARPVFRRCAAAALAPLT